jgi:hypothetical protein
MDSHERIGNTIIDHFRTGCWSLPADDIAAVATIWLIDTARILYKDSGRGALASICPFTHPGFVRPYFKSPCTGTYVFQTAAK